MCEVRPLRSAGVPPLRRYYEPVRLPAEADPWLWFPTGRRGVAGRRASPGLPAPLSLCRRALSPLTPGGPTSAVARCFLVGGRLQHLWQTGRRHAVSRGRTGFACARARVFVVRRGPSPWPAADPRPRTGPLRTSGYPRVPDRHYMVNEQFTWLTPLSQRETKGTHWRTQAHEDRRENPRGSTHSARPSSS